MSTIKVNNLESSTGGGVAAKLTSVNGGQLSNRNIIINGAITVSQRQETTQTTVPHDTSFYTVDRFAVFDKIDGGNNFTYQQTTAPVPDGFSHALKINTAIADTSISADNYAFFYQIVEGKNGYFYDNHFSHLLV